MKSVFSKTADVCAFVTFAAETKTTTTMWLKERMIFAECDLNCNNSASVHVVDFTRWPVKTRLNHTIIS